MSAAATVIKSSGLEPGANLGAVIAGGVSAGALFVGTSAANKFLNSNNTANKTVDNAIKKSSSSDAFNAKSVIEESESVDTPVYNVMTFLYI